MDPKSRGRASRGRARGAPQGAGAQPQGGPRPGPPQGAPPQGAWGARPGGPPQGPPQQQAPQGAWGGRAQPPQQAPAPAQQQWAARPPAPEALPQMDGLYDRSPIKQTVGRGSRQGGGDERGPEAARTGQVAQGGDGVCGERRGGGNGGVRGRTNRNEIIDTRPHNQTKKGTDGTPIRLRANFFQVTHKQGWGLNQYRVDIAPEIDNTSTRKYLVRTGLRPIVNGYLFDGTVLYTPNRLHPEPLELTVQNDAGENYKITIRLVGEVRWGDYHYLQLFNIIMRKCLTFMQLKLMGRNYFDPQSKIAIHEHNLELWPGYFMTMRQFERGIMLNVDLSFKVLRTDNVYDLLLECGNSRNVREEFTSRVIGNVVLTYYNQKTYRVDDVDWNQSPASSFEKRDGTSITYAQYFQDRYHVNIAVNNQPLLVSRSSPREIRAGMPEVILLVPSLCIMTGLTPRQRENFQLMKALGEHTRVGPKTRVDKLYDFSRRFHANADAVQEVARWDLALSKDLVQLQGRVLPQENLLLRNNQQIGTGDEADWTRNLRSGPMYSAAACDTFAVLAPPRNQRDAEQFVKGCLIKAAQGMNFSLGRAEYIPMRHDQPQSYLDAIEEAVNKHAAKIVLCVVPNNSADKYNAIKKKCYIDKALPCQVIVGRNLTSKGAMSIATKVAIQMNCKLGGAPWGCSMPQKTMVVGYDVCRDTANRGKSFAGMVASIDTGCSKYFSHTVEHEHEQELSSNIASFLLMACQAFKKENHVIPERIVVYRDGVGDGQIPYVKEHEVEVAKKKLKDELYGAQPLKMAFIIVSKRINVKLVREVPGQPKNDFNPPPGTVVDDVITWPERYDFYLISQCVRQGTVAPTSYNVIEDTLGIDANRLQRFTFKQCHMYYNWSGTVRVPAPCQYAHKLAFLTAQSLHRTANPRLQESLYFL